ncbi:protein CUP-SHAPED COTYLEDON 3-like [Curcuma longa]|uniref:protein CUP-SHAPED COTYLEDON 3-like n=1 Tax=Curcuma longa TaxID=136217 RepID=UPI003D9ED287
MEFFSSRKLVGVDKVGNRYFTRAEEIDGIDAGKLGADEWYFFSFGDRKYATGSRTNRATKSGYWKATGKDREVSDPTTGDAVGMRKTLVFYRGRAPNGAKTNWVMHELKLEMPRSPSKFMWQEDWVMCRVFEKRKGERDQVKEPTFLY